VVKGETGTPPYDGPMSLPIDHSDEADVMARSGAAARALECTGTPYDGGGADYADSGLESVKDDPEAALADWFAKEGTGWGMPDSEYRVERRDGDRVLFSYDAEGRTRAAVIVADGIKDWKHHTGWGVETWAQCDPSELPAAFTDRRNLGVWTDAEGRRVPVSEVLSFQGAAHCGWEDITFLRIGEEARRVDDRLEEYVRDTDGELARELHGEFEARASVPSTATDTGWRRDGRELWVVPDKSAAYLVSVDDSTDVERWPASTVPIGCD